MEGAEVLPDPKVGGAVELDAHLPALGECHDPLAGRLMPEHLGVAEVVVVVLDDGVVGIAREIEGGTIVVAFSIEAPSGAVGGAMTTQDPLKTAPSSSRVRATVCSVQCMRSVEVACPHDMLPHWLPWGLYW